MAAGAAVTALTGVFEAVVVASVVVAAPGAAGADDALRAQRVALALVPLTPLRKENQDNNTNIPVDQDRRKRTKSDRSMITKRLNCWISSYPTFHASFASRQSIPCVVHPCETGFLKQTRKFNFLTKTTRLLRV